MGDLDQHQCLIQTLEIEGITPEHIALREKIISTLRKGVQPIHIAICGSKAKGLASPTSDFDIKIIVMHSKRDYMLQNNKATRRLKTEYNGIEVEGTIMDVLMITTKWVVKSNPTIYECLAGIPIYKTPYSEKLSQLWKKAYNWEIIRHSVTGMIMGYKNKKLSIDKTKKDLTTCKLACEAVYLGFKLLFIQQDCTTPPEFNFRRLFNILGGVLTDEQKKWIEELAAQRIKDRNSNWRMTKEFYKFVDQCLESSPKQPSSISQKLIENQYRNDLNSEDGEEIELANQASIKEQADKLFLSLFE